MRSCGAGGRDCCCWRPRSSEGSRSPNKTTCRISPVAKLAEERSRNPALTVPKGCTLSPLSPRLPCWSSPLLSRVTFLLDAWIERDGALVVLRVAAQRHVLGCLLASRLVVPARDVRQSNDGSVDVEPPGDVVLHENGQQSRAELVEIRIADVIRVENLPGQCRSP